LDALLVPHAFTALTRMKYVPAESVVLVDVAVLPVSVDDTSEAPDEVPISTRYEVGVPEAAIHDNVTVVPDTDAVSPPGADGTVHGGATTVKTASFDAALVPHAFVARMRAK
jgi:hypothetical protein